MNTIASVNQTFLLYECFDSYLGIVIALSSSVLDLLFFVPLHIWILSMCLTDMKKGKGIPASDIFTVALSLTEIVSFFGFFMCIVSLVFEISWTMYIAVFMLGEFLIGRPLMNSLICLERLIAVVYPVLFHKFSTVRLRYICVAVGSLVTWSLGAHAILSFPRIPLQSYSIFLTACLLCITACSLVVLKALLKPIPGNKETKRMHNKTKKSFWVITSILGHLFASYFLMLVVAVIKTNISYDTFCLLEGISMWCLRPSSAIQPMLYLSKYKKLPCIKKT